MEWLASRFGRRIDRGALGIARRGLAMLLLLAVGALASAAEDETTVETLVFVGELVSIEPMPDPCEEEARRTGTLGCISMDALYRATYRVVMPVVGQSAGEVTMGIADHYGFPGFAFFPHALLFVGAYKDGPWLHKYQGIPMHRTSDGQWAACGEVDHRGVDKALSNRAKPLAFERSVAARKGFSKEGWERLLPMWKEQRDTYRIERGQVHCLKGIPLSETYEIVRQGVMAAREVPLPPWPADLSE